MTQSISNDFKESIEEIIKLFQKGLLDESLEKSEKLIKKGIPSPFLFNLNALINISLKNWEVAKTSLNEAILINKDYVEAHNNLGIVFTNLGDSDKAIEKFSKCIELKKDYANGYNNLGSVYDDLGKHQEAIDNYSKALDFNSKHTDAQNNLIHLLTYFKPKTKKKNSIVIANEKKNNIKNNFSIDGEIDKFELSNFFRNSNKIIKDNIRELAFFETQIYRRNTVDLNCKRHHKAFIKFNIIPEYCFGCYKIQIEPKNVLDLIKLFFVFDKLILSKNNTRKCTIELRPEVSGTYKGLIYCAGLNEANEVLSLITPILKDKIDQKIKIIIKRGCSEFAISYPNYKNIDKNDMSFMNYKKEWKIKENFIDQEIINESLKKKKIFKNTILGVTVSDILIVNNWLNYAKSINDTSYKHITQEMFYSDYILKTISSQQEKRKKEFLEI